MEFKKQKEEILKRAKKAGACEDKYEEAYKSENTEQLLQVVKNNIRWCLEEKMLDKKSLVEIFGEEKLNEQYIFTTGEHNIEVEKDCYIVMLGSSSANVEAWDSSSANVKTWGSSSANVRTYSNSSANVRTYSNSSANVRTYSNSSANVEALGSSSANVEAWGSSSANVEAWGSSSELTTKVKGDYSYIRNHNNNTIYVKKDMFSIEYVD